MKVFWSWQSDVPGKIGRHFVRAALEEAIAGLKEAKDIEEPSEREAREAIHLDHDRKGVEGSSDLAPTIFKKIDQSAVFVADVSLVGESRETVKPGETPRKMINSNVAIEYGYALHRLTDRRILMVQNIYYGDREELPFDLKHKAGPIQFRLEPQATKSEIEAELARLRGEFKNALKPYIGTDAPALALAPQFQEISSTANVAFYWDPSEPLATLETGLQGRPENVDRIEYRFNEPSAFYLRLIPTRPLSERELAPIV